MTIGTTDIGKQRIVVTLFCPTRDASGMERAINSIVLGHYWRRRDPAGAREPSSPARLEG